MYNVIFNSGFIGLLIWALLFAVGTAALAMAIRCAWGLRRKRFVPAEYESETLPLLRNGDWQGAYDRSGRNASLIDEITCAALLAAQDKGRGGWRELASAMLDKRAREAARRIASLSMCGNIAPMLGLLGTVTGMVDAFTGLGTALGPEKASTLAIAISQALYTTAAGLLAAVPAIALSVVFRNTLERRAEAVAEAAEQLFELLPEPERRPGHDTATRKLAPEHI